MKLRIFCGLLILISILYFYWWLAWLFAIVFAFYFPKYYEIIFFGIMYDALYGIKLNMFYNSEILFTILGMLIFLISSYMRTKLIIYDQI